MAEPSDYDRAFLGAAVLASCLLYAPHLGFYSDDWAFIGRYANAADQTIRGFYDASFSPQHAMRPIQVWLCAALYRVFGLAPHGYHAFNTLLLVANPLLLYGIFRRLGIARIAALAVALVYGVTPSYSTDRYWFVAFAITLSMTLCLGSIRAGLEAVRSPGMRGVAWMVASACALAASVLAYEVTLPLLAASPVLLVWEARRDSAHGPPARWRRAAVLIGVAAVLLAALIAFKLHTTVRLGAEHGIARQMADILRQAVRTDMPYGHYGLNAFSALRVHFGEYGLELPRVSLALARSSRPAIVAAAGAFTLLAFAYLVAVFGRSSWPAPRAWVAIGMSGLCVFGLGYAIFLTNYNVQFTATGIANRSAIAAAVGAAMCAVAATALAISWLPGRLRAPLLAAIVAAIAGCDFLIVNAVAERWVEAYRTEQAVLAEIHRRFPRLPSRSTLLLDGVCPYVGPAIVFEADWDLAGALQTIYRDPTVAADVVTPRLAIEDDAVTTTIYGASKRYSYGDALILYRAGGSASHTLRDAATARALLGERRDSCPAGHEGVGVRLF